MDGCREEASSSRGKGRGGAGGAYIIHFSLLMQRQLYYLTVEASGEVYGSNH